MLLANNSCANLSMMFQNCFKIKYLDFLLCKKNPNCLNFMCIYIFLKCCDYHWHNFNSFHVFSLTNVCRQNCLSLLYDLGKDSAPQCDVSDQLKLTISHTMIDSIAVSLFADIFVEFDKYWDGCSNPTGEDAKSLMGLS